MILIFILTGI